MNIFIIWVRKPKRNCFAHKIPLVPGHIPPVPLLLKASPTPQSILQNRAFLFLTVPLQHQRRDIVRFTMSTAVLHSFLHLLPTTVLSFLFL